MPTQSSDQIIIEVAKEIHDLVVSQLKTERGTHLETAVASVAILAGTSLFRSFKLPTQGMKPGSPILSDLANQRGPELVNIVGAMLNRWGVAIKSEDIITNIPPDHVPHKALLDVQKEMEPAFQKILAKHKYDALDGARAAAIACARLIQEGREMLDPRISFGIAVDGFVRGSKTVPYPLQ